MQTFNDNKNHQKSNNLRYKNITPIPQTNQSFVQKMIMKIFD